MIENPVASQVNEDDGLSNKAVLEQPNCLLAYNPLKSADEFVECDKVGIQDVNSTYNNHLVTELENVPTHLTPTHLDKANELTVIIIPGITPMEGEKQTWPPSPKGTILEAKFDHILTEGGGYWRTLTDIEISFLWYQNGYSDTSAESG